MIYRGALDSVLLPKYHSGDQTKKNEICGACDTCGGTGDVQMCVQGFDCRTKVRILLGRPKRRWECNIKMDLQEARRVRTDWIYLTQDRDSLWALVNAVINLRVP